MEISVCDMGEDLCVVLTGGDRPHLGAVSLSVARESLRGGAGACTTSNLTLLGHKDDTLARYLSERLSCSLGKNVAALCGVHAENISEYEIEAVFRMVGQAAERIEKSKATEGRIK